ncbi:hypothetical protein LOZ58_000199 [Ophidiomyces ophidiicola]|nr:hypothetical protein LOZ58_000199 [Ophidiomyces ophidiicola]
MPELAEVARVVYFIRANLVGKTISTVVAEHDDLVFGKVGTSAEEFQQQMQGKKVVGVGQQGKYFWLVMSEPPHPVMHFGMTGWLSIKGVACCHYRASTAAQATSWPPKFCKFQLLFDDKAETEAAFVDPRRLGRVRLLNCPGADIRSHSPLKENGPDPVLDKAVITEAWLTERVAKKRVPIKALLLDQSIISGLGNWMADEVLYHSQIHPEQVSNTLREKQIGELHSAIHYVCSTAVDLLGDSARFPADWLMRHRWNKGKKEPSTMLNGDPISFVTVGGRTSAIVPTVQKKNPHIAELDASEERDHDVSATKSQSKKRKSTAKDVEELTAANGKKTRAHTSKTIVKQEASEVADEKVPESRTRLRKRKASPEKAEPDTKTPPAPAKKTKSRAADVTVEVKTTLRRGRSAAK